MSWTGQQQSQAYDILASEDQKLFSPGVGFGQVVGAGINLMDGEESRSCSTCRKQHLRQHITKKIILSLRLYI